MLDEKLGKWTFWLMFVGFNVTFFPQHFLGLLGMPRRVYTYDHGGLWEAYNLISTIGAGVMAVGVLIFFINVFRTRAPRRAGRATTRGSATRSSGSRPRRRRRRTSPQPVPYVSQPAAVARPAAAAEGARCASAL